MVSKCRNGLALEYLAEPISSNDTLRMYNTRNASQLRATITKTAHYHYNYTLFGSYLWNNLLSNINISHVVII